MTLALPPYEHSQNGVRWGQVPGRFRGARRTLALLWALAAVLSAEEPANLDSAVRAGRFAEAVRLADASLKGDPGNPRLWTLRGVALEQLDRLPESLRSFERALSISPKFLPGIEGAAETAYRLKDPRAIGFVERALDLAPDNETAHAMAGALAFEAKNFPAAAGHFARSGSATANNPSALTQYGASLIETGRNKEAAAQLKSALVQRPASIVARYDLGLALYLDGRSLEAIAALAPLSVGPRPDVDALNLMGAAEAAVNRVEEATRHLRTATEIAPADERNYLDLARLCLDHNSIDLALDVVTVGIKNAPASAALYTMRGAIYSQQAEVQKAQTDFDQAARLEPDTLYGSVGMSLLLRQTDQTAGALELLRAKLKHAPRDATLNYLLADCLWRSGADPAQAAFALAEKALAVAIHTKPDFAQAHSSLGKLYLRAGRTADALEELNLAIRYDATDRTALNQLVLALRQLGRENEAIEAAARLRAELEREKRVELELNRVRLVKSE